MLSEALPKTSTSVDGGSVEPCNAPFLISVVSMEKEVVGRAIEGMGKYFLAPPPVFKKKNT